MNPQQRPPLFSPWDLLALAGLAVLLVFHRHMLPQLPDPVPTHFDALGHPNGWTSKANLPWMLYGLPAVIWAFLMGIGALASAMEEDPRRVRAIAMKPLRGLVPLGLATVLGSCLLVPSRGQGVVFWALGIMFSLLAAGIVLLVLEQRKLMEQRPDVACYRWGVFYVNAADRRLFVPKRFGFGYTLNFGRRASWVILFMGFLPALAVLALLISRTGS